MEIDGIFISNVIAFILGVIFTYILSLIKNKLFGVNIEFFRIISDFKKLLPSKDKRAKINLESSYSHMDLTSLEHNISVKEIDLLLKSLEDINYDNIIFRKKWILSYSKNLQRLIKTTKWDKFLIGILDEITKDELLQSNKLYLINKSFYKYLKC